MSRNSGARSKHQKRKTRRNALIGIGAILAAGFLCFAITVSSSIWLIGRFQDNSSQSTVDAVPSWAVDSSELTVAVSPLMEPVLAEIAQRFNDQGYETSDGQRAIVRVIPLTPEDMVEESLQQPRFQAISPDSSLWIDQLENRWAATNTAEDDDDDLPISQRRTSGQTRYAVSPVVLIAWEDVARNLGWPDAAIGWQDIQRKATEDPEFKWNHPSTNTASGLLATLAEFYAGAGVVRGLTEEAATAQETLDYVQSVEATVRFYGEAEDVILQRLEEEGRDFLDAFVGQEQVVIDWNRRHPNNRLVAIYPIEGSLWTDHPLALLELGTHPSDIPVTANQRETYRLFSEYMISTDVQQSLLDSGYRPADLSLPLDQPTSPFAANNAVDWREPQTTLQIPAPSVVEVVLDAWQYTKRPTNVYLVVDTSGSMDGSKLDRTKEALSAFVEQVQGQRDELGIVEFGHEVKGFTPLRVLDDTSRRDMHLVIDNMDAVGGTALIDAVYAAAVDLQSRGDDEAINALVVMTDGLDNESVRSMRQLEQLLASDGFENLIVFTIAFGRDADEWLLNDMAASGRGQFRLADETDIEELYRTLSTYF